MQRILVAVDVETDNTELAVTLVSHLLRKVEWPNEVVNVEVGEAEEVESD